MGMPMVPATNMSNPHSQTMLQEHPTIPNSRYVFTIKHTSSAQWIKSTLLWRSLPLDLVRTRDIAWLLSCLSGVHPAPQEHDSASSNLHLLSWLKVFRYVRGNIMGTLFQTLPRYQGVFS